MYDVTGQMLRVAILMGGASYEHDVSVLSGIQVIEALDPTRFIALPVYITTTGQWFTGEALRRRSSYPLKEELKENLTRLTPNFGQAMCLETHPERFWQRRRNWPVDVVLPVLHGGVGENGAIQGLLDTLGIPYVGCRPLASAISMNKFFTKQVCDQCHIPHLSGYLIDLRRSSSCWIKAIQSSSDFDMTFPLCVKPNHLGSSVGVYQVDTWKDLQDCLEIIAQMDTHAVVESFVSNLVEYNVAISRAWGDVRLSAIERPERKDNILHFSDKYLVTDMPAKLYQTQQSSFIDDSRVFHPDELKSIQRDQILDWAKRFFIAIDAYGTARIDFLADGSTGEIWFNEINTIPGSMAYYLWQQATPSVTFTELLTTLIEEAMSLHQANTKFIKDLQFAQAKIF